MKKPLTFSLFLIATMLLISCKEQASYDKNEAVRPVKTVTIESADTKNFEFQGVIESDKKSRLAFRTGGQIIELNIDVGDRVSSGQVLAELDKKDMLEKLESDKVEFLTAQSIYNRDLELHKRKAISTEELEISRNNFERARYVYENTESQLNDMTLISPFDGIVEELNVELFQRVAAGEVILKIFDPGDLIIHMKVADRNFSYLKQSPEFKVAVETIPGELFDVSLIRFLEASPSGIGIPVFLAFDKNDLKKYEDQLRPGFAASIFMSVENPDIQDKNFILPVSSIFSDPDSKQLNVWVVNEDLTVTKRPVETREIIGSDKLEIISGVDENEIIVSSGVGFLQEGQKVKILQ